MDLSGQNGLDSCWLHCCGLDKARLSWTELDQAGPNSLLRLTVAIGVTGLDKTESEPNLISIIEIEIFEIEFELD